MSEDEVSDPIAQEFLSVETPKDLESLLNVIGIEEFMASCGFDSYGGFRRYQLLVQDAIILMRRGNPELPPCPTSDKKVDYQNWCIEAAVCLSKSDRRNVLWPLLSCLTVWVMLSGATVYGAWLLGEGHNLWQKCLASSWYFVIVSGACLIGFLLWAGKPGRQLVKRVKGED